VGQKSIRTVSVRYHHRVEVALVRRQALLGPTWPRTRIRKMMTKGMERAGIPA